MKKIHLVFVCGIRTHYIKAYAIQKMFEILPDELVSHFDFTYIDAQQHYDTALHDDFLSELGLSFEYSIVHENKEPAFLWSNMFQQLCLLYNCINEKEPISYVIVFGDVLTTVLASITAMFNHYKVVHIESGVRVITATSPEEKCRKTVDHLSTIRFTSNNKDLRFLQKEDLIENSFFSGDIMYDFISRAELFCADYSKYKFDSISYQFDLKQAYILISLHHKDNQNPTVIANLLSVLENYPYKVFFIVHPVMKKFFPKESYQNNRYVFSDHVPYLDNLNLIKNAEFIVSDSGGIQREAFYLNKRCIVRSDSTIWEAIIETGNNTVSSADYSSLKRAFDWAEKNKSRIISYDNSFGCGNAVYTILNTILKIEQGGDPIENS